jgi:hypothetical protein
VWGGAAVPEVAVTCRRRHRHQGRAVPAVYTLFVDGRREAALCADCCRLEKGRLERAGTDHWARLIRYRKAVV